MKRFKFRLDRLLKIKSRIQHEKQRDFALAERRASDQSEKLNALNDTKLKSYGSRRKRQLGKVSVETLRVFSRYFIRLKKVELESSAMLDALNAECSKKREFLVKASRETKTLENLRDRQREVYIKMVNSLETKEADETTSQRVAIARGEKL
ncbi:MAG: flagellar export protein FliJ [candidate division Zixibacteria bacterium]|nr:flagellar export protein FliJ [candidate division Zixibacteria bacterium]